MAILWSMVALLLNKLQRAPERIDQQLYPRCVDCLILGQDCAQESSEHLPTLSSRWSAQWHGTARPGSIDTKVKDAEAAGWGRPTLRFWCLRELLQLLHEASFCSSA
ncbi:hypothetical protein Micbo1qcDRAFT_72784 [Microdochium bolleyi]|uniref:Secreted protein n=1 Tax=Microdochium bolleyi TaxID=196109 RepID=A0A136J143_9PEZI|nr:hypothetical protein Micbo1qcDRAFT_72784 [Microdochium bolleyi]